MRLDGPGRGEVTAVGCMPGAAAGEGLELEDRLYDCGTMVFDRKRQDVHSGGSGCGCSAAVFNGYLLTGLKQGRWRRILFAPTGALLSPTSSFQGESIPGICHAVVISSTL